MIFKQKLYQRDGYSNNCDTDTVKSELLRAFAKSVDDLSAFLIFSFNSDIF